MLSKVKPFILVLALSAVGLGISAGSAAANPNGAFKIRNQATGRCIAGTLSVNGVNDIKSVACASATEQYWANYKDELVMYKSGIGVCLAADSYNDAISVNCGNTSGTGYGVTWSYSTLDYGKYTNLYNKTKGCYLEMSGSVVLCTPGWSGSSKQWTTVS